MKELNIKHRQSTDYRIGHLEIYTQKQTYPHHQNIPPNMTNIESNALFVDDLRELITNRVPNQQNTIILGNFNIHTDNLEDNDAIAFKNTMEAWY